MIIVTGCLGFIGSHFTRCLLDNEHSAVYGIDSMTYAANKQCLEEFSQSPLFTFANKDINDIEWLPEATHLYNFAAETHVDNSINQSKKFIHTNINGVAHLLDLIKEQSSFNRPTFVQISTDEVYGDEPIKSGFVETNLLKPSSPYAASKASADQLILGYARTYDIEYYIMRPTNNYGTHQYPEKLITKNIRHLLRNQKMILYGDGSNQRTWLHVLDTVDALCRLFIEDDIPKNEIYNISSDEIYSNKEILELILSNYKIGDHSTFDDYVTRVNNRKGEDKIYRVNSQKFKDASYWNIYWSYSCDFNIASNIKEIYDWCKQNIVNLP